MKGLLLKDIYVMGREVKLFILMILAFALIPQLFTQVFAIMYSAMLSITSIAYDEQAKWNHLATMMPYRKRDLVLSKYLIGIALTSAATLLSLISRLVVGTVKGEPLTDDGFFIYLMMLGGAYLLISINLPLIFKLGTERGRIAYLLIMMAFAALIAASTDLLKEATFLLSQMLPIGVLVIGIIAIPISIQVSSGIYQRKEL